MSDNDFEFALRLYEEGLLDDLLREVTMRILGLAGCAASKTPVVCNQLIAGLAQCRAEHTACHVHFRAHAGEIEIVLSSDDRCISRISQRLP